MIFNSIFDPIAVGPSNVSWESVKGYQASLKLMSLMQDGIVANFMGKT